MIDEELELLALELDAGLGGGAVQDIRQSDAWTFQLSVRVPGATRWLTCCVVPGLAHVFAGHAKLTTMVPLSAFLSSLRSKLVGCVIDRVGAVQGFSLLEIVFAVRNGELCRLCIETGRAWAGAWLCSVDNERLALIGRPSRRALDRFNVSEQQNDGCVVPLEPGVVRVGARAVVPKTGESGKDKDPGRELCIEGCEFGLSAALEKRYLAARSVWDLNLAKANAESRLQREVHRLEKRLAGIHSDLERLEAMVECLRSAELLKANLGIARRGMTSISVMDYLSSDPVTVEIPLLPELSPHENLARMFERYRKGRRGQAVVRERMAQTEQQLREVRHRLILLADATSCAGVEALCAATISPGPVGSARRRTPVSPEPGRHQSYRTFVSEAGRIIRVGKGGRDNAELTFRHCGPHDIWMHVAGFPGSHVVIVMSREQEPDQETLMDAGHLAVHYSKAPKHTFVEVLWTRRKWVKAVKGAEPGKVIALHEKTLGFTPQEARLRAVLERPYS